MFQRFLSNVAAHESLLAIHQLLSTVMSHHQPSIVVIITSHYQPYYTLINYYYITIVSDCSHVNHGQSLLDHDCYLLLTITNDLLLLLFVVNHTS